MSKKKKKQTRTQTSTWVYVIAGASFIPLCGVLFGIVAIVWGFFNVDRGGKKVMLVGLAGILFTFILYGALYYIGEVQRGGVADEARAQFAEAKLLDLIESIEHFKRQNGRYPHSLQEMQSQSEYPMSIQDPMDIRGSRPFHYELDPFGEFYYLLSAGIDGLPYTQDDILPGVSREQQENIGYRVKER